MYASALLIMNSAAHFPLQWVTLPWENIFGVRITELFIGRDIDWLSCHCMPSQP